jgi:hypothetical protein
LDFLRSWKKIAIANKKSRGTDGMTFIILFGKKMIKICFNMHMMAFMLSGMQIRMFYLIIMRVSRGIKAGFQAVTSVPMHMHNRVNLKKR